MPSIGVLGAIGGAAEGFSKFLSNEAQADRAARLEEIRAQNSRETNRQSNQQRHDLSLEELKAQEESSIRVENETAPRYGDVTEQSGMPGQVNEKTNKFEPLPARTSTSPFEKVVEAEEPVYEADGVTPVIDQATGEQKMKPVGFRYFTKSGEAGSSMADEAAAKFKATVDQVMEYNQSQGRNVTREAVEKAVKARQKAAQPN